jgi:DNA repair exonuclease SbcCD ATPase subunit
VLYLAEVVQRKSGIMGGSKSELKLLACQRNEQSWSAVSGDELVPADEANRYSSGALLLVDLTSSKQVQRIQEAGRPLVSILQNFSRLQEKFKTQEEEIEQWKQSLTYQSQELNRREMEMEARREQLEQIEEDFELLEQQKQEFESTRQEIVDLRAELERRQQELEGAWDHLRGEQRRLEEAQSEMLGHGVLDEQRAAEIQNILSHLGGVGQSLEHYESQVRYSADLVQHEQELLGQHWQSLEQYRADLAQRQSALEQRSQEQLLRWQEWQAAVAMFEQAKAELKLQEMALQTKQEYWQQLGLQVRGCDELKQKLHNAADGADSVAMEAVVDIQALEQMPIEQLESIVSGLQSDLEQSSMFVRGQEEELELKQQEIDELQGKLSQVSEFDRMTLETELADEQDAYQFLHETLVGQQRNLKEKESVLTQHRMVLDRRQGQTDAAGEDAVIDLTPVLSQLGELRSQSVVRQQQIEAEIAEVQQSVEQARHLVDAKKQELDAKQVELQQLESALQMQRLTCGELQGKVQLYEALLQPLQDDVDQLKQAIEEVSGQVAQLQCSDAEQQSALGQMYAVLNGLMPEPQLAAS